MERAGRLLAGLLLLCTLSSTAAQWVMSASQRDDCTMETQRLYHCATYSSPTTLLSDAQKGMCCEAVSQFQVSGCFCGWGDAATMNPWTQDVLLDLASAAEACTGGSVSCPSDEEYLLNRAPTISYGGSTMSALQKATGAVSSIVAQKGWSSSTAGKGGSGSSSSVAGGGAQAAAGEPVLDLRVVNRLLPSGASASGIPGDTFGPGDFDLEVEVEQEGGDPEETAALVSQLMDWMLSLVSTASKGVRGRAGGGDSAALVAAAMMDRMDRSDTLGGVLEAITDILSAVLNGTDAQVEVALEITVETTTSTVGTDPSTPDADARALRAPTLPAPHMSRGFDQRVATEVGDSADAHARGRPACYMHQLYATVSAHPARFFAVLAAAASLVLLGSLIAQLASLAAREAAQPVQAMQCAVVANPLLASDLTVPLMDVRGALSQGYSRGLTGQPPSYVPR